MTSVWFGYDVGVDILSQSFVDSKWYQSLIYSGALLDFMIGIWLLSGVYLKQNAIVQIIVMVGFTILISVLVPQFWLHPFGPVTKNVPIIVLLLVWIKELKKSMRKKLDNRH